MNWKLMLAASLLAMQSTLADPLMWKDAGVVVRGADGVSIYTAQAAREDGHVFVCWATSRDGARAIYGQLVSPDGVALWGQDGKLLALPAEGRFEWPAVTAVEDGWVIGWLESRDNDSYYWHNPHAQKIDDGGHRLWAAGEIAGLTVDTSSAPINEASLRVVDDGAGGAFFCWEDTRRGDASDIYAQRIATDGMAVWESSLAVTNVINEQYLGDAIGDGTGSMIVCWTDRRVSNNRNLFAAKVTADGMTPWGESGVLFCGANGAQASPRAVSDGNGGAVFAWQDSRAENYDVYAQRVDGDGISLWQTDGVPLALDPEVQQSPNLCASRNGDSVDGAICVWSDYRVNGYVPEVFGQKLNLDGTAVWTQNGLRICGNAGPDFAGNSRREARVISDMSGGAVITWLDERDGDWFPDEESYVARMGAGGEFVWGSDCGIRIFGKSPSFALTIPLLAGGNAVIIGSGQNGEGSEIGLQMASIQQGTMLLEEPLALDPTALTGSVYTHAVVQMSDQRAAVVWSDSRHTWRGTLIYYQILDQSGAGQFDDGGMPLFPAVPDRGHYYQDLPAVVPDGNGGFHVGIEDLFEGTRVMRYGHVNADGNLDSDPAGSLVWYPTGILDQSNLRIAPAGNGECFVGWSGYAENFTLDVYVMRLSVTGERLWQQPTMLLRSTELDDWIYDIIPSGPDGCIVVWGNGDFQMYRARATRLHSNGTVDWDVDLTAPGGNVDDCVVLSDGESGAFVAWTGRFGGADDKDLFAQHLDGDGEKLWLEFGLTVCSALYDQINPVLCLDEGGHLLCVWEDFRSGADLDLFGQRLSPGGLHMWPLEGKPICLRTGEQRNATSVAISQDNYYIYWNGNTGWDYAVYGIRLNAAGDVTGDPFWTANGAPISPPEGNHSTPRVVADGAEGMYCAWQDYRPTYGKDWVNGLRAQRIYDNPLAADKRHAQAATDYSLSQNYPNPFNATTEIQFSLPITTRARLVIYDLNGRVVATLVDRVLQSGEHFAIFDASQLPSGIYFYRLQAGEFQQTQKMVLIK